MINEQTLTEHREDVVNQIHTTLSQLPLDSYLQNLRFQAVVKCYPLETLLLGRGLESEVYHTRIRRWIHHSLQHSPYVNN
jgi:hypothetical protein